MNVGASYRLRKSATSLDVSIAVATLSDNDLDSADRLIAKSELVNASDINFPNPLMSVDTPTDSDSALATVIARAPISEPDAVSYTVLPKPRRYESEAVIVSNIFLIIPSVKVMMSDNKSESSVFLVISFEVDDVSVPVGLSEISRRASELSSLISAPVIAS